jgi:hypothetical protein
MCRSRALGLSYRKVANVLEVIFGERVISHQEIRDHTLQVADQIKAIDVGRENEADPQEGTKRCDTLLDTVGTAHGLPYGWRRVIIIS